jgi:hypothetical protein
MSQNPVGPITSTTVPLVYDSDTGGFGGPIDMTGPVVGTVSYRQTNASALQLSITVDFGQPNSTYDVFFTCGPAHSMACGFISIGSLVTDAIGAGSASITVGLGKLLSGPFGPGYRTDHLDLLAGVGDIGRGLLTAGAINYFVCRREGIVGEEQVERAEAVSGEGDPVGMGATATSQDPLAGKQG